MSRIVAEMIQIERDRVLDPIGYDFNDHACVCNPGKAGTEATK